MYWPEINAPPTTPTISAISTMPEALGAHAAHELQIERHIDAGADIDDHHHEAEDRRQSGSPDWRTGSAAAPVRGRHSRWRRNSAPSTRKARIRPTIGTEIQAIAVAAPGQREQQADGRRHHQRRAEIIDMMRHTLGRNVRQRLARDLDRQET